MPTHLLGANFKSFHHDEIYIGNKIKALPDLQTVLTTVSSYAIFPWLGIEADDRIVEHDAGGERVSF